MKSNIAMLIFSETSEIKALYASITIVRIAICEFGLQILEIKIVVASILLFGYDDINVLTLKRTSIGIKDVSWLFNT